jgi:hypoxanthine phosphoribosyltransferase
MKQVFLSYHDIHTDCIELAKKIKKKYKPEKLILISRGGLIPGSIIANYLGIQDVDVIALKNIRRQKKIKRDKGL